LLANKPVLINTLAIAYAPAMGRIVLPVGRTTVTSHFTAGTEVPATAVIVVVMMMDHPHLPMRPVEGTEVERGTDPVSAAPVKTDAGAESGGVMPVDRRVGRPAPGTVDITRVVVGHIHHPGTGRLDIDVFGLPNHAHMLVGLQGAVLVSLGSEVLNSVDDFLFLHQEGITHSLGPFQVLIQAG